ncbi:PREDICTED: pentatricopeptide repeat-containing protein At3g22470, mitochondrial-like [Populus euphratica]|uniref:Pentatricopeptide repeat-containing protein At3g22470, mitochondrial-like n=1 Tax=Populus euphratica TaxID=75702 RepID=A0AAJ6T186_POPEU|nr:PREDICTED: pentatricopeptide repeat-containing protein At3g22470, mitochondrial-like [Populus euphratica]
MKRSTVKPNLVIYTILDDSLCNCGKLKDGKELFYGHSDEGFLPNVYTYAGLIAALCKGLMIEAHKIFRQMPATHLTYNVIIQGFLQHKYPSMAMQLVEMVNRECSADAATIALLIDVSINNEIPALKV